MSVTNTVFDDAEIAIKQFHALLDEKLLDRASKTLNAIRRNDAWGDIAEYSNVDAANPELADLSAEFEEFAAEMQTAHDAWADEENN